MIRIFFFSELFGHFIFIYQLIFLKIWIGFDI